MRPNSDTRLVSLRGNSLFRCGKDKTIQAKEPFSLGLARAESFIQELNDSSAFGKPVVTEVKPLSEFYEAEEYHRKYYANNSYQPYCQVVISPKLDKLHKQFTELLKSQRK